MHVEACSVARWQPKEIQLPELKFFAPIDYNGTRLTSANPQNFYSNYIRMLEYNDALNKWPWVEDAQKKNLALCCWCNIIQQKKKGMSNIVCHTIPLGWYLKQHGFEVCFDPERIQYGIDYKNIIKESKHNEFIF